MTNRFPLIVNTSANQIQELAAGDNLDLSSSNISNVGNITVFSTLSSANVTATGTSQFSTIQKYNENVITNATVTGAVTPDVSAGTIFKYTLTGNVTISSLANVVAGSGATIILIQDGTGSRTLTSTMKFLGGAKTLSTAASAIDIMSVFYDGTTYYASLGKGYA